MCNIYNTLPGLPLVHERLTAAERNKELEVRNASDDEIEQQRRLLEVMLGKALCMC